MTSLFGMRTNLQNTRPDNTTASLAHVSVDHTRLSDAATSGLSLDRFHNGITSVRLSDA
jgi:hypothetical protein